MDDFDAYWQGIANRRAAHKQGCREVMNRRRTRKAQKQAIPKPVPKARRKPEEKQQADWMDYREYLKSKEWARKRALALDYYGRKCAVCGAVTGLQVHHKTYKRLGHEKLKDLQVLCDGCHSIEHESKPGVFASDPISEQFRAIVA